MAILKTTDYNQFKRIKGNRIVVPGHATRLMTSISENNLLEDNPILVNAKLEVLDGQHRLDAAKKLGVEIYYKIGKAKNLTDVQRLNTYSRNWTMPDYLESYIEGGSSDYALLKAFMMKYQLPLGLSVAYLSGKEHMTPTLKKAYKEGTFEVVDEDFANEMAEKVIEIRKYCEENSWKDREFLSSLSVMWTHLTPEELVETVQLSGKKITRRATRIDYLRQFEDLYREAFKKTRRFY